MSVKLELEVSCCMCSETFKAEVDMPEGWGHRHDGIYDKQDGFCPRHSAIEDFAAAQCPGCVSGWGDCGLWKDFAYRKMKLSDEDLAQIRKGSCPRRINGTFSFDGTRIRDENLSELADTKSGTALAEAILEYCETYGEKGRPVDN